MSETSIFDSLHQGVSNRFACGALTAVAHQPGEVYNPLWIYGPSGTGKTALLDATASALGRHPSRPLILRIHAEQLVHDMIRAIEHRTTEDFRARILGFQIIIVDHLDCLSGKEYTQLEVAHLLVTAARQGCQVILASAYPPDLLATLDQKLTAHCEWLLRCDIQAPGPEERLEITRQMAQARKLPLSEQMTCRIAFAAGTPARIRCILDHLAARRALLPEEDALSEALDHLLKQEVPA